MFVIESSAGLADLLDYTISGINSNPTPASQPKVQSQANCIATSERPLFPYMYNQDRMFQLKVMPYGNTVVLTPHPSNEATLFAKKLSPH